MTTLNVRDAAGRVAGPTAAADSASTGPVLTAIARTVVALGRALLIAVPVLLVSTFITFMLGGLTEQDPASLVLGDSATPADVARMREVFGLDKPLLLRYLLWLWSALHGDLGSSWFSKIPVAQSIAERLPVSLSVAVGALLIAVVLGCVFGILAAVRQGGWLDRTVTVVTSVLATVPGFIAAIALITVFSLLVPVLPSGGWVPPSAGLWKWASFLLLPSVSLSLDAAADVARQLRTGMADTLHENYIVGAQVRGLPGWRIVLVHALRNGAGPAVAVLGMHVPRLIGGAVIVETVFALPGIGDLTKTAALGGDVPVVQGALLVTIGVVLISSALVNVLLVKLRPAARREI
ncbi:ABC transporter permease [Sphaerisporangium perillae]|uniref:ABC transporter permease n=1 Tax=Sphaerisporangium perillae TaxID=2935860 RepID=UPI00200EA4DE|nr:ABC transporter permease [Sphaerisporangium perillae]